MAAMGGSNPFYTWRSIMVGREVLKMGLMCKIESRCSVNIWKDPWLPSKLRYMVGEP